MSYRRLMGSMILTLNLPEVPFVPLYALALVSRPPQCAKGVSSQTKGKERDDVSAIEIWIIVWLIHSFSHTFIQSFTHLFIWFFIHSFFLSFIYSFIHSFTDSFNSRCLSLDSKEYQTFNVERKKIYYKAKKSECTYNTVTDWEYQNIRMGM